MEYRLYTSGGMEYLVYFSTLVYRTIREHQPNAQFQPDKILYPTDLHSLYFLHQLLMAHR